VLYTGVLVPVLYTHIIFPDAWSNEYILPIVVPKSTIPLSAVGGLETASPSGNVYVQTLDGVVVSSARNVLLFAKNTVLPDPNAGEKHCAMLEDHKKFRLSSNSVTLFAVAAIILPLVMDIAGDVSTRESFTLLLSIGLARRL
jgi:hypothetical protein